MPYGMLLDMFVDIYGRKLRGKTQKWLLYQLSKVMLAHIFSIQLNQKKPSSFSHYNKLTIGYTYSMNNHGLYHAYVYFP